MEVWFRRAKHPFSVFLSCNPIRQTLPQEIAIPKPGDRGKPQGPCCAQTASFSCVSLDRFVSLLGVKLWEGSFSALLPFPGGITPLTGVAQEEAWSNLPPWMGCTRVEVGPSACRWTQTSAAQPALFSYEALQGLWHQKQNRNVTGLSPTSASSHSPASPVPFIPSSSSHRELDGPASSKQGQHLLPRISFGAWMWGRSTHIYTRKQTDANL